MLIWIQPSRFASSGPASPPLNDTFTRANETPLAGIYDLSGSADLVSNQVVTSTFGMIKPKTSAYTFTGNHKCDLDTTASDFTTGAATQPCVRFQPDFSCYRLILSPPASAFYIQKVIWNGTGFDITNLVNQDSTSYAGGIIGLRMSGTTITAYTFAGDVVSTTDATLSGGVPGFIVEGNLAAVTAWTGDDIP